MNLPNKLTIFRIILVPIMVIVPFFTNTKEVFEIPLNLLIIDAIFIIASITDKLDGYLARKNNQVTTFGKFLDPIADKILVLAALIMLVEMQKIPAWIPIIVLFREFIVSGYRLIASQNGGKVIAASIWGKIKTVTQMIGIMIMFLSNYSYFQFVFRVDSIQKMMINSASIYMSTSQYIINILGSILITISVIATVFSGINYLKDGKDLLLEDK